MCHNTSMIRGALLVAMGMCLLPSTAPAAGQNSSFDIASFTPPVKWQTEHGRDFVAFTDIDTIKGIYCRLAIYVGDSTVREPQSQFAHEWKDIVLPAFSGSLPAASAGHTASGLAYLAGGARVEQGGKASYAYLLTFTASPKIVSVLTLVPDRAALEAYRLPIQAFLESIRFSSGAPPAHGAKPTGPDRHENQDVGSFRSGGLAGVWMGFKQLTMLGSYEPSPRWMTFFDDGQAFDDIPSGGLDGFDRSASKADEDQRIYWGTYTYHDGSGIFKRLLGGPDTRIKLEKPDQIKVDGLYSYYRCPNVDGLRLDGAWAGYADPGDPRWRNVPIGQRMVLCFSKDARFTDEGIFASLLGTGGSQSPQNAAGLGTYEIKSFSLILHYSDGRLKKVPITGLMNANPASNNDILFISRARLNKIR